MGKSQIKRLREATKRFGREDWNRLANAKATLSVLVYARKMEVNLVTPIVPGSTLTKRHCTSPSHQQNELTYGKPLKQ